MRSTQTLLDFGFVDPFFFGFCYCSGDIPGLFLNLRRHLSCLSHFFEQYSSQLVCTINAAEGVAFVFRFVCRIRVLELTSRWK